MSAFESTYPSLIQGVSQQQPEFRQPGQVANQLNMLSDPVHGLRRRPGTKEMSWTYFADRLIDELLVGSAELGGRIIHYQMDTKIGSLVVRDDQFNLVQTLSLAPYIENSKITDISAVVVADELYFLNRRRVPTVTRESGYPYLLKGGGHVFVRAGVSNTKYEVTAEIGTVKVTYAYTTPSGAAPGDAAQTTPEAIASALTQGLAAAVAAHPDLSTGTRIRMATTPVNTPGFTSGAAFVIELNGSNLDTNAFGKLSSSTPTAYMDVSNGYLSDAAKLPPIFPIKWNGGTVYDSASELVIATGSLSQPTYYKFVPGKQAWLECAGPELVEGVAYRNPVSTITNTPIAIGLSGGVWTVRATSWEGRSAGDSTSNPLPNWVGAGITGMGTYQGRLVLLSGPYVTMSASSKPKRFLRTTVTTLVDSDPIQVSSTAASASTYTHCIQFQKDLLVFGKGTQSVIPSNNQAITPRTATVVVIGEYTFDGVAPPISLLNSVVISRPNNADYSGFAEVKPTGAVASLYAIEDATPHLPAYFRGTIPFSAVSLSSGTAVFGSSVDTSSLYVHQFIWNGPDKVQQAWHKWTFPLQLCTAYMSRGYLYVAAYVPNIRIPPGTPGIPGTVGTAVRIWRMNVKAQPHSVGEPYMDGYYETTPTNAGPLQGRIEARNMQLIAARTAPQYLNVQMGYYDPVVDGVVIDSTDIGYAVAIGYPYTSSFVPSEPVLRKQDGTAYVSSDKLTIVKYTGTLTNSGPFQATVQLSYAPAETYTLPTVRNSTAAFALPVAAVAPRASVDVGVRAVASEHTIQFATSGTYEMNFKALNFTERHHQKLRRI